MSNKVDLPQPVLPQITLKLPLINLRFILSRILLLGKKLKDTFFSIKDLLNVL